MDMRILVSSRIQGLVSRKLPVALLAVKEERLAENEDSAVGSRTKEQREHRTDSYYH